jgi:hypothetical protein
VENRATWKQRADSSTVCGSTRERAGARFFQQGKPNKTGLKKTLKNRLQAM